MAESTVIEASSRGTPSIAEELHLSEDLHRRNGIPKLDTELPSWLQGGGKDMPFAVIALALYALAGWSVYLAMAAVRVN